MQKWDLKLSKFKGKYFVYLVNTCTNSIVKKKNAILKSMY